MTLAKHREIEPYLLRGKLVELRKLAAQCSFGPTEIRIECGYDSSVFFRLRLGSFLHTVPSQGR
uniref:Uncharacterized protein n=1 Tax=Physcomitrium patens TaxID=3218 RepID=A0A2K1KGT9_PHYPA|nr:hypothetical protein PHYPA_009369 [Physcomitrium patens]